MIIIDERAGSKDLALNPCMQERCVVGRLDFGDAMLSGHGPDGSMITVGVEVKSVADLLSSISTGRLGGHQIPGMLRTYDDSWLLIHGIYRPGPDNCLQVRRGKVWKTYHLGRRPVPWSYVEGFLFTAQMLGGLRVKNVYDFNEAASWLVVMDHWLEKPWEKHRGLSVFDKSRATSAIPEADPVEQQMAKTASSLPALDWVRGWAAAKHFQSVSQMMDAGVEEWKSVKGIGSVIAQSVVTAIRRQKENNSSRPEPTHRDKNHATT